MKDSAIRALMVSRAKRDEAETRQKRAEEYAMRKREEAKAANEKVAKARREKKRLEGENVVKSENRLLRQMAGYPYQDSRSKEYAHEAIKGFEDILHKVVNGQTFEIRWISRNGDLARIFLECMRYNEKENAYQGGCVQDFRDGVT